MYRPSHRHSVTKQTLYPRDETLFSRLTFEATPALAVNTKPLSFDGLLYAMPNIRVVRDTCDRCTFPNYQIAFGDPEQLTLRRARLLSLLISSGAQRWRPPVAGGDRCVTIASAGRLRAGIVSAVGSRSRRRYRIGTCVPQNRSIPAVCACPNSRSPNGQKLPSVNEPSLHTLLNEWAT